MQNVIKLVKATWRLKQSIKKCQTFTEGSTETILANDFDRVFESWEDAKVDNSTIHAMVEDIKEKQVMYEGQASVQALLSSVLAFLEAIIDINTKHY